MKVLFAVSNEEISNAIVKKYQKVYKEIISYKNVYYFNAILKEIQKDKSYDRIVISEELEMFLTTNYDELDIFIFEIARWIAEISSNETNWSGFGQFLFSSIGNELGICFIGMFNITIIYLFIKYRAVISLRYREKCD